MVRPSALLLLVGVLLAGCGEESSLPLIREVESTEHARVLADAQNAIAGRPNISLAELRAKNPRNVVGRAHNAMLREFLHEYTTTSIGKPCQSIRRAWTRVAQEFSGEGLAIEGPEMIDAPLARYVKCENGFTKTASFELPVVESHASLVIPSESYLDAINAAVYSASSANQFNLLVDAIVTDAEHDLSGDDLEEVYVAASVALDSYDYWATTGGMSTMADSMDSAYGSCLTTAEEPSTCFYDASAREGSRQAPRGFFLASSSMKRCDASPWSSIAADGAAGWNTFRTTRSWQLSVAAAGTASIAVGIANVVAYLICIYQQ